MRFLRYEAQPNGVWAILVFTNTGPTRVWLWDSTQLWQAEVETSTGRGTHTADFASVTGERIEPASNRTIAVPLPSDTLRWRVTTTFGFHDRPDVAGELHDRLWRSAIGRKCPDFIWSAIDWFFDLLPNVETSNDVVSTPWIPLERLPVESGAAGSARVDEWK